jgi:hypothetical protein
VTGLRCWDRMAPASRTSSVCWPAAAPILIVNISPSVILLSPLFAILARRSSVLGCDRAGSLKPTIILSCWVEPCSRFCIGVMIIGRGWGARRRRASLTATSWPRPPKQRFESLSGGQQARLQILLLELSGATLLLLDEPTDNLDLESAEALEQGLDPFEGTVLAVTHDRWFARSFDRFLIFGADGSVYESTEPVWDEARVERLR